ncbi:putative NUDIX hydrolase-like domain superfamily [Helianthus annuus]|nr:putative NUDIX hydrolase-like domain superfamily [Helianthus annuus]
MNIIYREREREKKMSKERLAGLAQQLRIYKVPVAADDDDDDAVGQPSEGFRPKKAAEEDDVDDADTATREAHEEIGLHPSLVDVHLLRVIPVIGILSDRDAFNPTPNAAEVDDVFDAPLEMFLKDENQRSEKREWMGEEYLVHYFDYQHHQQQQHQVVVVIRNILFGV